jgi:mannose-6-phosphate isomerase-like protein (cupin superfamily)
MDELDKAAEIALKGPLAERALAGQRRQMQEWGITMPPGQAIVLDFGLGHFDEIGEIEHWIANEVKEGYCGKFLFVHDGQTCPTHYHREKHETFFIVKGSVLMMLDGVERKMTEGDVLSVDRCRAHRFTGIGPALLLEIAKPCVVSDNYFDDRNIKIGRGHEEQRHLTAHGSEPIRGARRQDHVPSGDKTRGKPLRDAR